MKHRVTIEVQGSEGSGIWNTGTIEWEGENGYYNPKREAVIAYLRHTFHELPFGKIKDENYEGWERLTINLSDEICRSEKNCCETLTPEERAEGICWECTYTSDSSEEE